jgi:signal transduction histidine kinase/CheY-like chemotaxis protein
MPTHPKPLSLLSWSIGLSVMLAAVLGATTLWLSARMEADEQWVRHTFAVQNQIARVLMLAQRVETNQRGFLLTGQEAYLGHYKDAETALPAAINETAKLVADNPHQQQMLARLRRVVANKVHELRSTIDEKSAGHSGAALAIVNSEGGLEMTNEIRQLLSAMGSEEARLLSLREATTRTVRTLLQIGAAVAFLLICTVGLLVAFYTRRSFTELTAAHNQLAVTNQQLIEQMQQREQTETQLRQMQKIKAIGDLTGGIAHDFNNMLGAIAAALNLIQRHIQKGDFGIERFVDAANQAAERGASLTRRLLAFARKQPLSPEIVDANKMIVQMSDLLRSTLGEHIRIETVSAAGLWSTNADLSQLENAVLNIAINARDAMPEGGRLTIETGNAYLDEGYCKNCAEVEPGQHVMIAITDTGAGMPPDVIARAFDPFFTTKPEGVGTGLGLSQVYGFIRQSRGHIRIYSEPGAGTTVKIYLPRSIGDVKEITGTSVTVQHGTHDDIILVVEDDPLMRQLAADVLRDLGYTVFDSENAADALAILDDRPGVKLLFTDVVMPEINGKELAEEAIRRRPGLKVLFTTGYARNAVVHGNVLDRGAQLLSKPFTPDQLAAKIRAVLDA